MDARRVHLLVQLRTRVLDGTLDAEFSRWREQRHYPKCNQNCRLMPPAAPIWQTRLSDHAGTAGIEPMGCGWRNRFVRRIRLSDTQGRCASCRLGGLWLWSPSKGRLRSMPFSGRIAGQCPRKAELPALGDCRRRRHSRPGMRPVTRPGKGGAACWG
jgi:hypothetical protein